MELFERIRHDKREEGLTVRALSRRHKVHRRTVRQALASALPPPRAVPARAAPVMAPWRPIIRAWLIADREAPRKQRHTARRVWQRLLEEHDADVAESTVRAYVRELRRELDTLLTFLDFPAEHAIHLRSTNPIESTFSTVRLRTRVTKGAGSRAAGLAMAFKLLEAAQGNWRRINAPQLVPLVRAGAVFIDGQLQERRTQPEDTQPNEEDVAA